MCDRYRRATSVTSLLIFIIIVYGKISYNLLILLPHNFCGVVLINSSFSCFEKSECEVYFICRFTEFSNLFSLCLLTLSVSKVYSVIFNIEHYMYILMQYINIFTYNTGTCVSVKVKVN